ncbi:MAG TPA: NAD(P)H-hydrate dehydratase [Thermoanaerobaculia bacterium]|nr:NAD(P)H-hydrate dehydratase [Thermoanaerobaculia bacterium]
MKILTSDQMKNIDRRAIEQFLIPSIVLMENAALAVVDAIAAHHSAADEVAIFCGLGQNGGDGFAVARHLENRGVTPLVFVVGERSKVTGDAGVNLRICERLGLPVYEITGSDSLTEALARTMGCDLIVDAIFGTGLNRALTGLHEETVRGLGGLPIPVLAIDIPSGLQASNWNVEEPVLRAQITVTFAQPKLAHVFEPAALECGEVIVADISIPRAAVDAEGVTLSLITSEELRPLFPARESATHKGTYGHVAIVGGSEGRSGAAVLGARGALRTGAGLVTVLTDRETARIVDGHSVESMTRAIRVSKDGLSEALSLVEDKSALLIGPGLADNDDSYQFVRDFLSATTVPAVIDASALNAFAGKIDAINPQGLPRVITPHPGELGRLLGLKAGDVNADRLATAREAARLSRCVIVLKGHQTIVADPDGELFVNPTGNPGMATGGMGDILGGVIAALIARGVDVLSAACAGVYLHGSAGDILMEATSDTGLTALDVANMIPAAIERLRRGM